MGCLGGICGKDNVSQWPLSCSPSPSSSILPSCCPVTTLAVRNPAPHKTFLGDLSANMGLRYNILVDNNQLAENERQSHT
eukprot:9598709-Ditylum_brightwellii.AAC.1